MRTATFFFGVYLFIFKVSSKSERYNVVEKKIFCECTTLLQCRAKVLIYLCDDACRLL